MSDLLPIADGPDLRAQARRPGRRHRGALAGMVGLHAAAAAAGLAGPPLLGKIVQALQDGTTRRHIDILVLVLAAALVVQTIVTFLARLASFVLSEKMFAELSSVKTDRNLLAGLFVEVARCLNQEVGPKSVGKGAVEPARSWGPT